MLIVVASLSHAQTSRKHTKHHYIRRTVRIKTHRVIKKHRGIKYHHYYRYRKTIHTRRVVKRRIKVPRRLVASNIKPTRLNYKSIRHQPHFYSYAAIAMDAKTGEILIRKHSNVREPIASISKLMSAMVLLDAKLDMDQYITITSADSDYIKHTPSRLVNGSQLRRRDLLLLSLMSSENKATHALARTAYPGGIPEFLRLMNQKAKAIGMVNTHFNSPTGLTFQNQSTAEDLLHLVSAAIKYNLIRQDTTTKYADVALTHSYVHRYLNSDRLVRYGHIQIELSKTGFINEAGECLVLYIIVNSHPVILVFLDSQFNQGRFIDAKSAEAYLSKVL